MSSSLRLYLSSSFEQAWVEVLVPWFKKAVSHASQNTLPCAAVVPSHALASLLKARLVEANIPLYNIYLWTPEDLGKYLRTIYLSSKKIALREDLRLLMSAAADEFSNQPAANAVASNPDDLLLAYDTLLRAAHDKMSLTSELGRGILSRFEKMLTQSGLLSEPQAERLMAEGHAEEGRLISLLLYGFGGREWRYLSLLQAAKKSAEKVTLCLSDSRCESDRLWQATLEEIYGEAQLVSNPEEDTKSPFRITAQLLELDSRGEFEPDQNPVIYRIAANIREEAIAVVAQGLQFLMQPNCRRLGIVLPKHSAVAREVSACLIQFEIPHHDTIGHYPVQPDRQALLNRWLDFQNDPRLSPIISFLHLCREQHIVTVVDAIKIEAYIKRTYETLMTDDFRVIRSWLHDNEPEGVGSIFLDSWQLLPTHATMVDFLTLSVDALSALGWKSEVESLPSNTPSLRKVLNTPIDRRHFLKWLGDILRTPGRNRHPLGRHSLSPLQLLSYDQIGDQSFSHLVLAGLNQGAWPFETPTNLFLSDTHLDRLNRTVVQQGSQGEGHQVVIKGRGYLLTMEEKRLQAKAEFINLLETVSEGLAVSASLSAENDFNQSALVSDLLLRLYWADRGSFLDDRQMQSISRETAARCEKFSQLLPERTPGIERMLHAFNIRRDLNKPFGEFEFSFQSPPRGGIRLSCKRFEDILRRPAAVWLESVLQARKPSDYNQSIQLPLVIGNWVHRWLRFSLIQGFSPILKEEEWEAKVYDHAHSLRDNVARAYAKADRELPDWWNACWSEAFHYGKNLVNCVSQVEGWPFVAAEFNLPENTVGLAGDDIQLPLSGRIDLVLSTECISDIRKKNEFTNNTQFWVVDFKTGNDKALSTSLLKKGEGVQIALYALALHSRGCNKIWASTLQPNGELSKQLSLENILELGDLWEGLAAIQHSGVFGMTGPIYSRFAFVGDYPIATLSISEDILNAKWNMSHPLLTLTQGS